MPFGGRSIAGAGEGVELARGYISLTAKYSPAMQMIANDFRALEQEAGKAGIVAGQRLKQGITTSGGVKLGTHLRSEFAKAGRVMASDAEAYGTMIGGMLGRGIAAPFRLADKAVGSLGQSIKNTVTGPMAKMIGGTTLLGVAFETLGKGFTLDTDIQDAQIALKAFGASTQEVQGFMDSMHQALKGSMYSFTELSGVARDLFNEGIRGDALTNKLRGLQDVAAITKTDIEQVFGLYEQTIGQGTLNPMMLRKLQASHIDARGILEKMYGLPNTVEGSNALNKMLKGKDFNVDVEAFWNTFFAMGAGGMAKMEKGWAGQMKLLQTNLQLVGGDILKGLFGAPSDKDWGINQQLTKLDNWVNANQDKIKNWFHEAANAAHELWDALSDIVGFLKNDFPGGIKGVVIAFAAWKGISAVASLAEGLGKISTGLKGIASDAPAAGGALEAFGATSEMAISGLAISIGAIGTAIAGIAVGLGVSIPAAIQGVQRQNATARGEGWTDQITGAWHALPKPDTSHDVPWDSPKGPLGNLAPTPAPTAPVPGPAPPAPGGTDWTHPFSHAKGAMISGPVAPNGIVQWAEPSTGGEAYIPLGSANRSRSLAIWAETGHRLGVQGAGYTGPAWGKWGTNPPNGPGKKAGNKGLPHGQQSFPGWWQKIIDSDDDAVPWWEFPGGVIDPRTERGIGGGGHRPQTWEHHAKGAFKFDKGGINDSGDFGTSAGAPAVPPPDENQIRSWVQQNFGIPNSEGTGSWENAAHSYDQGWHHRGMGGKSAKSGYAFDFHGTPAQMSALANWVATNWSKDTLELIYGGSGFDQNREIKNGRFGNVYGAGTNAEHRDHVHWAMTQAPFGMKDALPVDISKVGGKEFGSGGGKGSGGGGGDLTSMLPEPFSQLASIAQGGLKESLLPPGFTDYSQNSWVKSGKAGLGMLLGMAGVGGGKGSGGMLGGFDPMHPARAALAQMNPERAAQLGWTQGVGDNGKPGELGAAPTMDPGAMFGTSGGSKPTIKYSKLKPGHGGGGSSGGGITVNGSVMDEGSLARLNKIQKEKKTVDARHNGPGGQSTTMRGPAQQ